jgi:lipid II:glycine glycyltransferase (peptidoglycan interpeptide bridge formation enzyme)
MALAFKIDLNPEDTEWDELVSTSIVPNAEQACAWAHFKARAGWRAFRVKVYDDGRLCGGAQVLERPFRSWLRVGHIYFGPVATDPHERINGFIGQALINACRLRRLTYLVLRLPVEGAIWLEPLIHRKFRRKPEAFPPFYGGHCTLQIDLTRPEGELLSAMRSRTANSIRRALRGGLKVRMGDRRDLPKFEQLLLGLCQRRRVDSNFPTGKPLSELWDWYAAHQRIQLFLVEADGHPTCGLMLETHGSCARARASGWDGRFEKLYPTQLVYWEAIRWARAAGFSRFDMGGLGVKDASQVQSPEGRSRIGGSTFFKLGFGGTLVAMPKPLCYFPNPILRHLVASLHDGGMFEKVIRRLVNHIGEPFARLERFYKL